MDAVFTNHGSLIGLKPMTPAASEWITNNLPTTVQWFGQEVMIEPRYASPIFEGMQNDGLEVE